MLEAFISASERELLNERAVAVQIVKYLGLSPIASENRTAGPTSIQKWYQRKVRESDIYIGIFGTVYSSPTIDEYKIASGEGKPLLLFEKVLGSKVEREKDLVDFLTNVKHSPDNVVVAPYQNVIDLKIQIKRAIIEYLCDQYVECRSKGLTKTERRLEYPYPDFPQLLQRVDKKAEYIPLGSGNITKFEIQTDIDKTQDIRVSASFNGSVTNGFLDLMIMTADGSKYWSPDYRSWDAIRSIGTLSLSNAPYSSSWVFTLPDSVKTGPSLGFLGMYEDTVELPTYNRRLIDYKIKKLFIR